MGVIINAIENVGATNMQQASISHTGKIKTFTKLSKNVNTCFDGGLAACPVVSECKDVLLGLVRRDQK